MAETINILGMQFEHGEVLTSQKMNELAKAVDNIIGGINNEAQRALKAEQALQKSITDMQEALDKALETEKDRAQSAEKTLLELLENTNALYRGTATSANNLRGEENIGFWLVRPQFSTSIYVVASWVLVTTDSQGNTYQWMLGGNMNKLLIGEDIGTFMRTRYHDRVTDEWSAWLTISAEKIAEVIAKVAAHDDNIKEQNLTIDTAILNKQVGPPLDKPIE